MPKKAIVYTINIADKATNNMSNEAAKKLAKNMKRIREKKGMTQGDICRALNTDRGYISSIESAKRNPTLSTIEKIAKTLGVEVGELLK